MKELRYAVFLMAILMVFSCSPQQESQEEAPESTPETQQEEQETAAQEPIKIGAIFAITGSASKLGEPERNTAVMLVEKINEEGGINGRPIELFVEDTEGEEAKALIAVKKLVQKDEVCAIIGPSRSGVTMAVIPYMQEQEVPLISCAAADAIVTPVKEWVFKTPQKNSATVINIFNHMKAKDISKIAIITGTTGFGKEGRDKLKEMAPDHDIEIVADLTYGPGDTDMTAQLTQIKGTDAQAVVNWSIVPGQSIVPKNMKQLEMDIPLYQSHGFGNIAFVEAAGEAAEGIVFPAGALLVVEQLPDDHPRKDFLMKYKEEYEARFDGKASTFGGHAYDALMMLVEALNNVGTDREAIRDYLENNIEDFMGTAGFFTMSPEDHTGLTDEAFELIVVQNGEFNLLEE